MSSVSVIHPDVVKMTADCFGESSAAAQALKEAATMRSPLFLKSKHRIIVVEMAE